MQTRQSSDTNGKSNGNKKEGDSNGNGNGRGKSGTEEKTERNTKYHPKCKLWYPPYGFHMHCENCKGGYNSDNHNIEDESDAGYL